MSETETNEVIKTSAQGRASEETEFVPQKLTVAQAIVRCLEAEGIEQAFGLTGSHLLAFFNALKDSQIKYISVKHENAAGFMALYYAKVSQKPALVLATAGPGAVNLINGVAELYKTNIPSFILTPTVPTSSFGKGGFQEDSGYGASYSINKIMQNITKKSILAFKAEKIQEHMHELFRCCLTPPLGPVHLSVPTDIFVKEIESNIVEPPSYRLINDERIELNKIDKAISHLLSAKAPLILIGNRCIYPDCSDILEELINSFKIPFVMAEASKGLLDEKSDLFCGVTDYFGHRSAEKFIKESDLIFAFGLDFSETETIRYDPDLFKNSILISFDYDPLKIGINYGTKLGIAGNIPTIIDKIIISLKNRKYKSPWEPSDVREKFLEYNAHQIKEMSEVSSPLKVPYILNTISNIIDENSLTIMDGSAIGLSSLRHFTSRKKAFYAYGVGCSISEAVAGVIGAKIASDKKSMFCISGDGAFLMHGNEVLTAVQYNLGISWIIFKEDLYNMIEINQCLAYDGKLDFCTKIRNPDYKYLAKAYGVHYFEINTSKDIPITIRKAMALNRRNKCALIIIHYDYDQHLPIKPRIVQTMKDLGQTKNITGNPYLMRAFKKAIQEKV